MKGAADRPPAHSCRYFCRYELRSVRRLRAERRLYRPEGFSSDSRTTAPIARPSAIPITIVKSVIHIARLLRWRDMRAGKSSGSDNARGDRPFPCFGRFPRWRTKETQNLCRFRLKHDRRLEIRQQYAQVEFPQFQRYAPQPTLQLDVSVEGNANRIAHIRIRE